MRMRHFAKDEYKDQIYIPDCRPDGAFDLMQCDGRREVCWCVNENGQEIDGTRKPYDKNISLRQKVPYKGCRPYREVATCAQFSKKHCLE